MKRILVVEDNQLVANVYRNKLAVEGYQTEVALDGESGLKLMQTFHPDAMVLDIHLPQMSGIEVIRTIRGGTEFAKLPIVVLSNTYSATLIQDAWKAGATKCVSKIDCSPQTMVEIMRHTIGDSGAMKRPRPATTNGSATHKAVSAGRNDEAVQREVRIVFIGSLPVILAALRANLKELVKATTEEQQLRYIREIYDRVHTVNGSAALAGMNQIAHMAAALEILLRELYQNPDKINDSTLRTTAIAVDFFGFLFENGVQPGKQDMPPASILVVDDEEIARRAIVHALEKAQLHAENMGDPEAALKLLSEKHFDVVLLDIDMPFMTGYDLCASLRALPHHKQTPVIFVTRLSDFGNRAKSNRSGGNDFIAKPFLPIELGVKALVHILRRKLQPQMAA